MAFFRRILVSLGELRICLLWTEQSVTHQEVQGGGWAPPRFVEKLVLWGKGEECEQKSQGLEMDSWSKVLGEKSQRRHLLLRAYWEEV